MITWHLFGYANRHRIYYQTKIKHGSIRLWSSYTGLAVGADPTVNGDDLVTRYTASHGVINDGIWGVNQYTEFQIGDAKDVLSLLAALIAIKNGRAYSFTNSEGRVISLSLAKEGKYEKDIITCNIQYGRSGKLTLDEAKDLETFAEEILLKLGFSDKEISGRINKIQEDS